MLRYLIKYQERKVANLWNIDMFEHANKLEDTSSDEKKYEEEAVKW